MSRIALASATSMMFIGCASSPEGRYEEAVTCTAFKAIWVIDAWVHGEGRESDGFAEAVAARGGYARIAAERGKRLGLSAGQVTDDIDAAVQRLQKKFGRGPDMDREYDRQMKRCVKMEKP